MKNPSKDLFHGLRGPDLPAGLKDQILARARAAAPYSDPAPAPVSSLMDRWWESRPLRLAWAMAVLLLVVAHVYLAQAPVVGDSAGGQSPPVVVAEVTSPFVEEMDLIQIVRWSRSSRKPPSGFEALWRRRLEDREMTSLIGRQGGSG